MITPYRFSKDTDAPVDTCGIYKIVHEATGRVYVGQTGRDGRNGGFARRCKEHLYFALEAKAQHTKSKFGAAVRKYGQKAFTFHVLQVIAASEPNHVFDEAEAGWIQSLDAASPENFNIHPNGSTPRGVKRSPETRLKMSISRKAAIAENPPWAQRLRERLSAANTEPSRREAFRAKNRDPEFVARRTAAMLAMRLDPVKMAEQIERSKNTRIANGANIKVGLATKLRMANPAIRNVKAKPVTCVETGVTYVSVNEAARQLGMHKQAITACINGRTHTAGGFHWIRDVTVANPETATPAANDGAAHLAA